MKIQIAMKTVKNLTKKVKTIPFLLEKIPQTFEELIEEIVKASVKAYHLRMKQQHSEKLLSEEEFAVMKETGKFAWSFLGEEKEVDEETAIDAAKEAISNGTVRVFKGTTELTDFSEALSISEEEVFTFIRLTMLAGRMW